MQLLAHAAPIAYRFPLPIWIYALAAGVAVLASAPAAATAVRAEGGAGQRSRNLYPALRPLRLGAAGLVFCTVLFAWALVGGFGARTAEGGEFFENPMTVLTWVDFWVLLGLISAFVGNLWDFVSPLNWAARLLDRTLAARDAPVRPYPERLGRWPAVVLLLVWSWMELIWDQAKEPRVLAALAVGYVAATLIGTAVFGAAAWLENVEVFTVIARTFGRFAPLEFRPGNPDEWLAATPAEREVRLRWFGAGIRTDERVPAGSAPLVLGLLATVVYDGWSQTNDYQRLVTWILGRVSWFGYHTDVLNTLLMVAIVGLFVLLYLSVCTVVDRGDGPLATARRYAPTLIPIAAVYFAAHYFTYLLFAGQTTLGTVVDPFGHSWNPWGLGEYPIRKGVITAAEVWWAQVALIVWGHVAGVFAAHRTGLREGRRPLQALAAQAPLVALMVAYTFAGLWVLGQQLKVGA